LKPKTQAVYRIQEFAKLAGVTVRALHHYDRVGLLTPTARSGAGYRLYRESDVARLEQIVVLKYLGLPLTRIGQVLAGEVSLNDALRSQNQVLSSRRRHLSLTIETLGDLEQAAAGGEPNWNTFAALVREAEADKHAALRLRKHCSDEMLTKIRERRQAWRMTLQDYELARDVRAAIARNETPASPAGQALAARWRDLVERFTEGDAEMKSAMSGMVAAWGQWTTAPLALQMRDFFLEAMKQASANS
jgi:DNA-binding transcriptional MerR regulator